MDNVSSKFSEQQLGNCCNCVPIRTGVLIYAVLMLLDSLLSLGSFVSDDTRLLVGGYTYHTRVIVGFLGFLGIFISLLGILGSHDNSSVLLRYFYYFTIVRIVVVLCVVCVDFDVLWRCEKWGAGVARHYNAMDVRSDEYNPIMDYVAQTGVCQETRLWYFLLGALDLILSSYYTWITRWYVSVIETCPAYLICLNHAKPPEFYSGYANLGVKEQDRVQQRVEEGIHRAEESASRMYHQYRD